MTRAEYARKREVIREAFEVDLLTRSQARKALRILAAKMKECA